MFTRLTPEKFRAKRSEEKERNLRALVGSVRPLVRGVYEGGVHDAVPKPKTYTSEKWLAAVRSIECCVRCGRHGTEPGHRNEGKGTGLKTHDCCTAAICRECHRELDQGATMMRDERRAELNRCIVLTLIQLVLAGKVRAT